MHNKLLIMKKTQIVTLLTAFIGSLFICTPCSADTNQVITISNGLISGSVSSAVADTTAVLFSTMPVEEIRIEANHYELVSRQPQGRIIRRYPFERRRMVVCPDYEIFYETNKTIGVGQSAIVCVYRVQVEDVEALASFLYASNAPDNSSVRTNLDILLKKTDDLGQPRVSGARP
jgi:hypothetical protein